MAWDDERMPADEPATAPRRAGRRPASSREAILDAAGELFLEHTYAGTTVDQIASRAGVSRASFFNYFGAKSDLLWGEVDDVVREIERALADAAGAHPLAEVRGALLEAAAAFGPERIPLAATQWSTMGARDDLVGSGLPRFAELATVVHRHLGARPVDRTAAYALVAAAVAACAEWAASGTGRGALVAPMRTALDPVCAAFAEPA